MSAQSKEVEVQSPESFLSLLAKMITGKAKGQLVVGVSLNIRDTDDGESEVAMPPSKTLNSGVAKLTQSTLAQLPQEGCPGDPAESHDSNDCSGQDTTEALGLAAATMIDHAHPPVPYPIASPSDTWIHCETSSPCGRLSSTPPSSVPQDCAARIAELETRVEMLQAMAEMQRTHHEAMMELALQNARLTERLAMLDRVGVSFDRTASVQSEPKVARVPAKTASQPTTTLGKNLGSVQVTEAACPTGDCPSVPEVQLSSAGITVQFPTCLQLPQKMRIDTDAIVEQVIRAVETRDANKRIGN